MKIPSLILKQLYTFGSLENEGDGVRFSLKNRLSDSVLTKVYEIRIDGEALPLVRWSSTSEVMASPIRPK